MLTAATLVTGHMIIIPYNAEVPANNEYGSTTVTCYCSYNNCRFWNCIIAKFICTAFSIQMYKKMFFEAVKKRLKIV